jgi:hypothetical protein
MNTALEINKVLLTMKEYFDDKLQNNTDILSGHGNDSSCASGTGFIPEKNG